MPAAAQLDMKALRKAVAAAIKGMKPGVPPPKTPGVRSDDVDAVVHLIYGTVLKEYQAHELKDVARHFDASKTTPDGGCLKASDGPFAKVGEGVYGSTWLTKDKTRIFKLSKVNLVDDPGHPVTESYDNARREFEVGKVAAKLGIAPRMHEAYFCCGSNDVCYHVIVMDAVSGTTLKKWLKAASAKQRASMRVKLLAAVAKLNAAGVEHSDLHSKNVMVTPEHEPVLIDFGLASWADDRRRDVDMINRTFSDTVGIDDITRHVAAVLISNGTIKV